MSVSWKISSSARSSWKKARRSRPDSLPRSLKLFQIETLEPDRVKPLEEMDREYAGYVVEMLGGNKTEAARLLGISRTSLWRMLKEE